MRSHRPPNWRGALLLSLLAGLAPAACFGADPPVAEPPAADGAFASAIDAAQRRTAKIFGAGIGRSPGYATGLIVSPQGDILTAQGVYLQGDLLRVTLPSGQNHEAKVVRRSDVLQLALLHIDAPTPDFFEISATPAAGKGDWILAVSNAFKVADGSEPLSVNIGVLSLRTKLDARRGFNDFPYVGDVYLLDAITSNPGAAGGAVVNSDGQLVGMIGKVIEAKATNTRLNFAVPSDVLKQFLAGMEPPPEPETPKPAAGQKGELGIRLFSLGGRNSPAYVDRVLPGSAAAKAGVKTDDLVLSLAGQLIRSGGDFRRLADSLRAGEEIVLEIKRKDQIITLKLTPGAAK